jgi:hypothetical protein
MEHITRLLIGVLIITTILGLATLSNIAHAYTYQVFQPTNPSISSSNTQGYLAQLPQCSISSNPYGGATGTFGLFNCVAINYGAISAVVWFYEPNGGQGALLGFSNAQYSSSPSTYTPWLYVGTNGYLYGNDWTGSYFGVSTSSAISPGWHMAVIEEWYSGGTYYIALYLDGTLVGQTSTTSLPQLFGSALPYSDVGTVYAGGWPNSNGGWFFFNGTIAYVAVYNTVLSQSQVQAATWASQTQQQQQSRLAVALGKYPQANSSLPQAQQLFTSTVCIRKVQTLWVTN